MDIRKHQQSYDLALANWDDAYERVINNLEDMSQMSFVMETINKELKRLYNQLHGGNWFTRIFKRNK